MNPTMLVMQLKHQPKMKSVKRHVMAKGRASGRTQRPGRVDQDIYNLPNRLEGTKCFRFRGVDLENPCDRNS